MKRKISYILLALIIAYSSLIGCIFAVGYYYEATVVAEEREEQHEDKINKLAKNRGIHKDYVKELNGELDIATDDKETSNSEVIDAVIDYYEHNDYSPLFEKSAPCGNYIDLFVPGYDNVDEISQDEKDFIYEISNYSYDNENVNMKAVEVFDSPALVIELYNIEPFISSIEDDMYDYIQEPTGPGIRSDLQQIFCLKDNVYIIGSALKNIPCNKGKFRT